MRVDSSGFQGFSALGYLPAPFSNNKAHLPSLSTDPTKNQHFHQVRPLYLQALIGNGNLFGEMCADKGLANLFIALNINQYEHLKDKYGEEGKGLVGKSFGPSIPPVFAATIMNPVFESFDKVVEQIATGHPIALILSI